MMYGLSHDYVLQQEAVWDQVRKVRRRGCRLCPLYKTAQSICTMGDGNVIAPLWLFGEAPGKREDDLEKPFQGRAGKLLDDTLASLGMDRWHVYIDNVVRCRPPENRKPERSEVDACMKYTHDVIRAAAPRVVVAMGATALYGLTGRDGITRLRGRKIWSKLGFIVVPTFHPAYVLRDMTQLATFKADLALAVKMLGLCDPFKEFREAKLKRENKC